MLQDILKYESIQKLIQGVKDDVLDYVGKDKICVVGLGENGVFYGQGFYFWFKNQGFDVDFTTINDEGKGLEEGKVKNKKVLMVDSHIITGRCYRQALNILKSKQGKLKIKDIKCAVLHDLRGLADFVAERYVSPEIKLDEIDLKIIKILSKDGKKSFIEIARSIGFTPVGAKGRVDRLINGGVLKLKGVINLEKFYSVSANIGVGADNLTCERLIKKLERNPIVYNLMKVSGGNKNLIIDVVTPNLKMVEEFVDREIRSERGVQFIEVNTGGLPILPKEISVEQFQPVAPQINLKEIHAKKVNLKPKAIIFDFDETLINSKPAKDNALKVISLKIYHYLKKKGANINLNRLDRTIRHLPEIMDKGGIYDRNLWWSLIVREFSKEELPKSFLNNFTKQYWKIVIAKSNLYKDTLLILAYLKNKGYILGLLSDTDGVKGLKFKRIEKMNFKKWFDSIVVAGDDIKATKPDTAPFRLILKKLNLKPKECVFVGNNPFVDIQGAQKLGMTTVLIKSTKRQSSWTGIKSDYIIRRLSELKEIF